MTDDDPKDRSRSAIERVNAERRHPGGRYNRSHGLAMTDEAHKALAALTPVQRGQMIEDALRERGLIPAVPF